MSDGRGCVVSVECNLEGPGTSLPCACRRLDGGFDVRDHGRRGVYLETLADLLAGEGAPGGVRGSIGGNNLDVVSAVGNLHGVEAIGLLGDLVLEQTPDGFAIAMNVERVDQIIISGPSQRADESSKRDDEEVETDVDL